MMKVCVIKFGNSAREAISRLAGDCSVVSICDPDFGGIALAQLLMPELEYYSDYSAAIRGRCDSVLITLSDKAAEIMLLAISYKKKIFLARGVDLGEDRERMALLAKRAKIDVEWEI